MAVSRNTGHSSTETFWERVFGQLSRHDLVLTAIPLVFALAWVVTFALPIPFLAALAGSAVLSAAVLVDALFVNPPCERGGSL
ncbi:hypothetical protein GRX03_14670 [Halovenus sp. WSH3]|uniref:Uncharacterized protein n=1 Tax=Halovenus carboxidivorans TaxID=2692199 RepID=A0A6B0T432_9EURY|nr:hypothetical protein [Halovenus carboxidivorans]MXR52844.1 hypothetical protein [Halovenus carboxidivorans]